METKTPKPQYISYVRYAPQKHERPAKRDYTVERRMLYVLMGYGVLLLLKAAFAYPGTAMTLLSVIGVSYSIVQGFKYRARKEAAKVHKTKIVVNELKKRKIIYI